MHPEAPPTTQRGLDTGFLVGVIMAALGGVGLFGSLIFLLIGGIFSAIFPAVFGTPFHDLDLDREARSCVGEVLGVYPNEGLRVNDEATVRILYRYDPGGGPREGEVLVVQSHDMSRLQMGTSVVVEYLPTDNDVSRIEGTRAELAGWAGALGMGFGVFGLVLTVICLVVTIVGIVVALRARRRQRTRGPT